MKIELYFFLLSVVYLAPTMPKPVCQILGICSSIVGVFIVFKG